MKLLRTILALGFLLVGSAAMAQEVKTISEPITLEDGTIIPAGSKSITSVSGGVTTVQYTKATGVLIAQKVEVAAPQAGNIKITITKPSKASTTGFEAVTVVVDSARKVVTPPTAAAPAVAPAPLTREVAVIPGNPTVPVPVQVIDTDTVVSPAGG